MSGLTTEQHRLVDEYLTFARGIARKMQANLRSLIEEDDAVSVAYVGLVEAARRFDPSKHDPSKGTIEQHFKNYAYLRIHGAVIDEVRRLSLLCRADLKAGMLARVRSLDEMQDEFSDIPAIALADLDATPELGVDLQRAMAKLNQREQAIMWAFAHGTTGKEIGEQLGITESRVSQIATKARQVLAKELDRSV